MPYIIKEFDTGFKVCKKNNLNKCFSTNPIPFENATKQLKAILLNEKRLVKMPKKLFLKQAKEVAKFRGYDEKQLKLSNDGKHKLEYNNIPFGSLKNMDFIQYLYNAKLNNISFDDAIKKMLNYRKRAYKVMKQTKNNFSPASLSFYILW